MALSKWLQYANSPHLHAKCGRWLYASQAMTPKVENGKPNSVLYALSRGYVVASPATRGRTNKASDGNFIGKAPAVIVDLRAATAYPTC